MRKFTPKEDQYIIDNYLKIPTKRISKNLGRSESSARQRLHLLGYKVPLEIAEGFRKESQIKTGNIPFNKGKKQKDYMAEEVIAKIKLTQFKKGNKPHNTKYDGYERITIDGYKEIRVDGKFLLKHRYEWEKLNGKLSDDLILVSKDGNSLNTKPDNWMPITRFENMKRNSGTENLKDNMVATYLSKDGRQTDKELKSLVLQYPNLIQAKRSELLLNRKIKEHGKK